jgi:outer membrane protein assembly factor BamA
LYERFVLGNSSTLRGWNKYDLDPLGGSRVAYASLNYRYQVLGVFYDTGSVWDKRHPSELHQSAGLTLATGQLRGSLLFSVAFPLRAGHVEPLFIMSTNF